jgi:hypothetical protein
LLGRLKEVLEPGDPMPWDNWYDVETRSFYQRRHIGGCPGLRPITQLAFERCTTGNHPTDLAHFPQALDLPSAALQTAARRKVAIVDRALISEILKRDGAPHQD